MARGDFKQAGLFDPIPYARNSATSKAAADSVRKPLQKMEADVLAAFHNAGARGLTTDECEVVTNMRHQSCSARVNGLAAKGLIKLAGEKRKTRSGRPAEVYVAVTK